MRGNLVRRQLPVLRFKGIEYLAMLVLDNS
jgi:hypothetical protein